MRWYERLRRSGEIAHVRRRGRPAAEATLVAYGSPQRAGATRVAVTVSKSVGGAVVRNLVRRRIRGALDGLPCPARPLRIVFVAKPAAAGALYERLAADVERALGRLAGPA